MGFSRVDEKSEKRSEGRNCLMAYGYDDASLTVIKTLLTQAGIDELLPVGEGGTGLVIRDLLAGTTQDIPCESLPSVPVAVFHAVSDRELNSFLHLYRTSGLIQPLFAVVTPTSENWRFGDLAVELLRERRTLEK